MIPDKKRFGYSRVLSAFTKIDPFLVKNAKNKSLFLARHTPRLLSPVLGTRTFPFSFLRFLSSRALVLDYLFFYRFSIDPLFSLLARRTVKFQKPLVKREKICYNTSRKPYRGVVQLVESRSPKPLVLGSSPSAPAKKKADCASNLLFSVKSAAGGRNPPLVDEIASR